MGVAGCGSVMFRSLRRSSALMDIRPPRMNDTGRVIVAHWLVPVKPSPVPPVPAATLVLLRDRSVDGFEVLLIRRHGASKFAAGDFVFPGGKIELSDGPADAAGSCPGVDAARAARALGLGAAPDAALGHWIGVIREPFDEAGILLAYAEDGRLARVDDQRGGRPPRRRAGCP